MTAPTWPASEPACYGVCCNRRKDCQRYHAVEAEGNPAQIVMDWCGPAGAEFVPVAAPAPTTSKAAA